MNTLKVPKYPDTKLLRVFEEAAEKSGQQWTMTCQLFGGRRISWEKISKPTEWESEGVNSTTQFIGKLELKIANDSFTLSRDNDEGIRAAYFDTLEVYFYRGYGEASAYQALVSEHLYKELGFLQLDKALPSFGDADLEAWNALHQAQLAKLEEVNLNLITKGQKRQEALDKAHDKRRRELEKEYATLRKKLEEEHREARVTFDSDHSELMTRIKEEHEENESSLTKSFKERRQKLEETFDEEQQALRTTYEKKEQKLIAFEEELAARKKLIDDLDNTGARRQIRQEILAEVKSRTEGFSVSEGTQKMRGLILGLMAGLVLAFALLTIWTTWELYEAISVRPIDNVWLVFSIVRQILFSAGTVGSILFFIRWQNRWFKQHADAEFQVKQFQLDIERASWAVETFLDWETNKDVTREMPEVLLKSLTRNLFNDSQSNDESTVNPADQLASALFGSASALKLKAGDNEVAISTKKLNRQKPIEVGEGD